MIARLRGVRPEDGRDTAAGGFTKKLEEMGARQAAASRSASDDERASDD